jgi:hypothetical protein
MDLVSTEIITVSNKDFHHSHGAGNPINAIRGHAGACGY